MNAKKRKEARYQRRKAAREANRKANLGAFDDFERVADFDNLYRAALGSLRGVSWKESIQRYEANALRNVAETRRKLLAGESVQSGFVEFTLRERGKTRRIKSVHISERVVQKSLCDNALVPLLSNTLIHDNGASIKGKGVHFALRRLVCHLSRYYRRNRTNGGYALLIDFKGFFDSIDHAVLFALLGRRVKDPRLRELAKNFIAVFGDGKSLGLGSQVSQICAVFFPDRLDHYIKEKLRIKYYGRYMDDMYLIHESKEYLKECLEVITGLCAKLKLTINMKKTRIVKLSDGVDFLKGKYRLLPSGKILRLPHPDSEKRMRRKLKKFKKLIALGRMSHYDLRAAYQSWRGNFLKRFNAGYRVFRMDGLYNDLFIKCRDNAAMEAKNENGLSREKRERSGLPHEP
jgi:retron-type reverse transcriptase